MLQETETEEEQAGQARVQQLLLRPGQRRRQLLPLQTVTKQPGHSDQAAGHTNTPIVIATKRKLFTGDHQASTMISKLGEFNWKIES